MLRYLKVNEGPRTLLLFGITQRLHGFSGPDWGQERPEMKSIRGSLIMCARGLISWRPKKRLFVAQSCKEAEFVALSVFVVDLLLLKKFRVKRLQEYYGYEHCEGTI